MKRFAVDGQTLFRSAIMLLYTLFIVRLTGTGAINLLVAPVIARVVQAGAVVTLILGAAGLYGSFTADPADPAHAHGHRPSGSRWNRTTLALFAVALCLGYTWKPQALGTDMIAKNPVQPAPSLLVSAPRVDPGLATAPGSPGDLRALGIVTQKEGELSQATIAENFSADPSQYWGRSVALTGFVYRPPGLPENVFILTRFFIFCCITDAFPFGIAVETPDAPRLANGTWVSVSGVIEPRPLPVLDQFQPTAWNPGAKEQPVITKSAVHPVPVPKEPYMIPR
jgi:uncharacterized repeat protein (TIGR03943 family)